MVEWAHFVVWSDSRRENNSISYSVAQRSSWVWLCSDNHVAIEIEDVWLNFFKLAHWTFLDGFKWDFPRSFCLKLLATKSNVMKFGDCYINEPRTLSFTMSNRSNNSLRFVWPELPHLKFLPRIGHLHPGGSKDVSVTYKVERPSRLTENDVTCRVSQVTFDRPLDEVADWDDRLKTVKWVAASRHPSSSDGLVESFYS